MKTIRLNSRGEDVVKLQELLNEHGYDVDTDGIFGRGTQQVVKEFQNDNGLSADGIVGPGTWNALMDSDSDDDSGDDSGSGGGFFDDLFNSLFGDDSSDKDSHDNDDDDEGDEEDADDMPTIRYKSRGAAVERLQEILNDLGYEVDTDGIFGKGTKHAVQDFQRENGLSADGIVGPGTWNALMNGDAEDRDDDDDDYEEEEEESNDYDEDDMPTIRYKSRGSAVERLQELLNDLGYEVDTDGIFGRGTDRAIKDFQKDQGLYPDGIVGPKTWKLLMNAEPEEDEEEGEEYEENHSDDFDEDDLPTIRYKSRGSAVEKLQELLNDLGYDVDTDGIFGKGTDRAIKDFQKDQGLYPDGIVGPKTWNLLMNAEPEDNEDEEEEYEDDHSDDFDEDDLPTIRYKSRGSAVKKLQELLNGLGYEVDTDGIFGKGTNQAIKDFQKDQGLYPDGVVGPKTWKLILNAEPEEDEEEEQDYDDNDDDEVDDNQLPTIRYKSKGSAVRRLQELLNDWGYEVDNDGIFGRGTDKAIKDFQEDNDIYPDGIVGPKTWALLMKDKPNHEEEEEEEDRDEEEFPTLRYKDRGNAVKKLQHLLNDRGYEVDTDGIFGKGTAHAVEDFQEDNGMYADGVVGPKTWKILMNTESSRKPSQPKVDRDEEEEDEYPTLRYKARGEAVKKMQKLLKAKGFDVDTDGIFGRGTENAVMDFQSANGCSADGIVGPSTWKLLMDKNSKGYEPEDYGDDEMMSSGDASSMKLTEEDYERAAHYLHVEVAAIKAVQEVESGGRGGFFSAGKPAILFEGHIFWRQLKNIGKDPNDYVSGNEDILYSKWTRSHYLGGIREYKRLNKAIEIDKSAARASASWGMFQIMGFNYRSCGCRSVNEFVAEMYKGEGHQLDLFVKFLKSNGWDKYLRALDWAGFARHYNGPGYASNRYDTKLRNAYNKHK